MEFEEWVRAEENMAFLNKMFASNQMRMQLNCVQFNHVLAAYLPGEHGIERVHFWRVCPNVILIRTKYLNPNMASFHRYVDRDEYYIKHSFSKEGRLIHITYQVSAEAKEILSRNGVGDGEKIPKPLLRELSRDGLIYTRGSGVENEGGIQSNDATERNPFLDLQPATQAWVFTRLECHPEVRVTVREFNEGGREMTEVTVSRPPDNFGRQLEAVAKMLDGTNFFSNLDLSYSTRISQNTLKIAHS